jgi:chromosomal replication initiation ATPase DnaA
VSFDKPQITNTYDKRPTWAKPLPEDATCPNCGGFLLDHPAIEDRRALAESMEGVNFERAVRATLAQQQCNCAALVAARERKHQLDANLPHPKDPKTFENFVVNDDNSDLYEAVLAFVHGQMSEHILVLCGTYGCGKSHLLEAAGRYWLTQNRTLRYEVVPDLLEVFRHTFADQYAADIRTWMGWYQSRELLLLDDLGMEKTSDWTRERITALVDDRLREGQLTVIATNNTEGEMLAQVGPRLTSRLYQTNRDLEEVRVVTSIAASWRQRR